MPDTADFRPDDTDLHDDAQAVCRLLYRAAEQVASLGRLGALHKARAEHMEATVQEVLANEWREKYYAEAGTSAKLRSDYAQAQARIAQLEAQVEELGHLYKNLEGDYGRAVARIRKLEYMLYEDDPVTEGYPLEAR